MKKLIIEARLNEYAQRDANPNVPWTTEEVIADAIACRDAGASIIHFHARSPEGGRSYAYESFADVVAGLRSSCDVLIHCTLGGETVTVAKTAQERLAHIVRMREQGLPPDFAPIDVGSSNVSTIDVAKGLYVPESEGLIYQNSTATAHYFADKFRECGVKPVLVVWHIGHLREAVQFVRQNWVDQPVYVLFLCTGNELIGGHPGTAKGLQAFIDFLPEDIKVEWAVCNYGGDLLEIAEQAISQGGHVAIGVGDWPYPALGQPSNAELVRRVVAMAKSLGREVATPAEARQMLGMQEKRVS